MVTFTYKAKKSTAETVTGQISAHDQEEAIDLINQLGLLPVSVMEQSSEAGDGKQTGKTIRRSYRSKKVKIKDLYVFSRQLSNLLKSGVSLLKGLSILEEQAQHLYFKSVIADIAWDIKNGKSFSEGLAKYPDVFSSLYITMIRAGEESGNLQKMLLSVSSYQKRQEEILSKVRTALAYPILMGVVGIATIYFILTFVLPRMGDLFTSLGDQLPLPTIILLKVSSVLSHGWLVVLIGICLGVLLIKQFIHSARGKVILSRLFLRLPVFGPIILKTELARFSRTLVLLLESGVSIIKSLDTAIPILSNELIKADLSACKESLTSGGSFGDGIKASKDIPDMMGYLISVGEQSGNLEEVLSEIAQSYEQETNEQIKTMTTLFEPMMILAVGAIVGFIVFAMLLPIFQMDVLAY